MAGVKELFLNKISKSNIDSIDTLLEYLKLVNVNKCTPSSSSNLHIFSINGKDQFENACVISSYLKDHDLIFSNENILIGNKYLQSVFYPMEALTDSTKSANGIVALSGLNGSDKFIIVKYPLFDDPTPMIKELAVGLKMNELRFKIPNIMYTYGGLFCSSPVNMNYIYTKVEKKLEERFILMMLSMLKSMDMMEIDNEYELEEYKMMFRNPGEELSQKIMLGIKMSDKSIIRNVYNNIRAIVNEGYDLIDEISDKKMKQQRINKLKQYEVIIKNIKSNNDFQMNIVSIMKKLYEEYSNIKDKVKDFDYAMFCNSNVLSTLLLGEYIPNSQTIDDIILEMSRDERFMMACQLIFTLNMAWKHCKFTHNDLHENNIMVRQMDDPIVITYQVTDKDYIELKTDKVAVIIDLGEASIKDGKYAFGEQKSNLQELTSVMEIFLPRYDEELQDDKLDKLKEIYDKYKNDEGEYEEYNEEIYKDIMKVYRM
jgi:hypothetical protein